MISIIIPCYNHNNILSRAVKSALSQTCEDYEIIIVDDGSDIEVEDIWHNRKVRIIRHDTNMGLSNALNTGIINSIGEWFVILAADDELHPDHLAMTSGHDDVDIVSTDMVVNGNVIRARAGDLSTLMTANCHSYAALIKRSMYDLVGGFKPTMNPSWEDYEFFLNCASHGAKWLHVPKGLHIYHRNPVGRDAIAQGKDRLLRGKMEGYHNDVFGLGRGLVTFIIPCYNHEQYLPDAVRSVFAQTYPHVKAVVVDDGSKGDVEDVLRDAGLIPDSRLQVIHKENGGLASARNAGMAIATTHYGSQYAVMLDADDMVAPTFIEELMHLVDDHHYVYTDVELFGDAWHVVDMEDYDCKKLRTKHLHPCSFLMLSNMWLDVVALRGYGYDENDVMRIGYEDWEFAIACVDAGWQGRRVPKPLFKYRNHKDGSMRTRAGKHAKLLAGYISSKHPKLMSGGTWEMGCSGCGGRSKFTKTGDVQISGVGIVDPGDALIVTYSGSTSSTITKVGRGGRIYKYSNDPKKTYGPVFSIVAADVHLFAHGPYTVQRPMEVVEKSADKLIEAEGTLSLPASPIPIKADDPIQVPEHAGIEYEADDFTETGMTDVQATKLVNGGIRYYEDVAEIAPEELAHMLNVTKARALKFIDKSQRLIEELGELIVE